MKNIEHILLDNGIELTEEQKKAISKEVNENYKTINDWQKKVDDVEALNTTLKETQEKLKAFDGVDATALNEEITKLKADLEKKDADYQAQIADRDFQDLLKESILSVKGKNTKAITALLDIDTLKASKNQKEDIAKALKVLTEAEDSKMLFGELESKIVETGNLIGQVQKPSSNTNDATMRAVMGLPTVSEQK